MGKALKPSLKNQFEFNPKKHLENARDDVKKNLSLNKKKPDTSAQDAALEQQRLQQAELDEEENRRRKRLLSAATGVRAFTGSPLFRRAPGNRAGAAAAPSGGPASRGYRGGGGDGSMIP